MATYTTKYNLKKPDGTDVVDINDINGNMDIIETELDKRISHSLATTANDFLVASGVGAFVKKTLAEVKTILGLGSAAYTASTAYATAAQGTKADNAATQSSLNSHLADYVRQPGYGVTAGSANTYTLTLSPALSAYSAGVGITVKINAANTGASTINVNGLGEKSILDSKGNALTAGKLRLNGIYTLRYDGTNFILQGEGGSGNATASDLLSGKTASTDAGDIMGNMPDFSAPYTNKIPTSLDVISQAGSIFAYTPKGYYGDLTNLRLHDDNFIAQNIPQGISMFGLAGNRKESYPEGAYGWSSGYSAFSGAPFQLSYAARFNKDNKSYGVYCDNTVAYNLRVHLVEYNTSGTVVSDTVIYTYGPFANALQITSVSFFNDCMIVSFNDQNVGGGPLRHLKLSYNGTLLDSAVTPAFITFLGINRNFYTIGIISGLTYLYNRAGTQLYNVPGGSPFIAHPLTDDLFLIYERYYGGAKVVKISTLTTREYAHSYTGWSSEYYYQMIIRSLLNNLSIIGGN